MSLAGLRSTRNEARGPLDCLRREEKLRSRWGQKSARKPHVASESLEFKLGPVTWHLDLSFLIYEMD